MEDQTFWERHGAAVGVGLGVILVALVVGILFTGGWLTPPPGGDDSSPVAGSPTISAGASPTDGPASSPTASLPPTAPTTPDSTATAAPATPDPEPTGAPAETAPATASPQATADSPSPVAPTTAPTEAPSITPGPASPSPASPSPAVGWVEITDFPTYRGGTTVEAIVAGGPGFVAVGNSGRQLRGRVWTSADGVRWAAAPDDQFRGFHLDFVVRAGDGLYMLGGNQDGRRAWRSGNGRAWTEMGLVTGLDGGVNDVTRAGGSFIAVGWAEDESGNQSSAVWRSTDGVAWQRVGAPEAPIDELWAVEARGNTLVAIPRWPILHLPLIVYSTDLGDSWQVAQTDVGVSDDFNIGLVSVAANDRRFVIVGYHELDDYVPLVLNSGDGSQWTSVTLTHPGFGFQQVVPLRGGEFLALGSGAHVSGDARSWREVAAPTTDEPPRPPEGGDEVVTFRELASGRGGVVVAQAWGDGVRVWFAPLSLFD